MSESISQTKASVILIAEMSPAEDIGRAVENVLSQTHQNLDVLVSLSNASQVRVEDISTDSRIRFFHGQNSLQELNRLKDTAEGDVVFYKGIQGVLWYPWHIRKYLDTFAENPEVVWAFSRIEYRSISRGNYPFNVIGLRVEHAPDIRSILLDEIAHRRNACLDWMQCVYSGPDQKPSFLPGLAIKQLSEVGAGTDPDAVSVVQLTRSVESTGQQPAMQYFASRLSVPAVVSISEGNFPLISGNHFLDREYNESVREMIHAADPDSIRSIGIKRTLGMGDVILVEPIIRKLRSLYPNAEIELYTARPDIAEFFAAKPDRTVGIGATNFLADKLSETENQIKFDLDLAYESRFQMSFIDAYAAVCGFTWECPDEKTPMLETDELTESMPEKPFVVVVGDGSGWVGKTWGREKWKEVVENLQNRGMTVVEPGQSELSGLTDPQWHNCDLQTLVGLINRCVCYIGADNGPMHIARAFAKPCVVVCGAALPVYSTPIKDGLISVCDNSLECIGCKHRHFVEYKNREMSFVPSCTREIQGECMQRIRPEQVLNAFDDLKSIQ